MFIWSNSKELFVYNKVKSYFINRFSSDFERNLFHLTFLLQAEIDPNCYMGTFDYDCIKYHFGFNLKTGELGVVQD